MAPTKLQERAAMRSVRFAVLPALVAALLAATSEPSFALADVFAAIDGQGADPLVDAYPFFVFPFEEKTAQLLFISDSYRGRVTLAVKCCKDTAGNPIPAPAGVTFYIDRGMGPAQPKPRPNAYKFRVQPGVYAARWGADTPTPAPPDPPDLKFNEFMTGGHHARWLGLTVLADVSAQPGRYVVEYDATSSDNKTVSTSVTVNILPAPSDVVMPSCAAFSTAMGSSSVPSGVSNSGPQLTPDNLAPITQSFLDQKRASPNKVDWTIATGIGTMMPQSAGVQFTLSKWHAALPPTQAVFYFTNYSDWDMQIVAMKTTQPLPCTPVVTIAVNRGDSASFLADTSTMSTFLFRRNDGKSGWENLSVLNHGPFWTLFGGREVDVDLIGR